MVTEIAPVLDYKECQAVCQARVGCQGWTWTTEDNAERQNYCSLYSSLGPTSQAPDCISGPPSCLCSKLEACLVEADNEIASYPNTLEEGDCRELCESSLGCGYYTWYDATDPSQASLCCLLSSCSERNSSCTSCHSAPVPCSQAISPTPTPPPPPPSNTSEVKHRNNNNFIRGNIKSSSSPEVPTPITLWRFTISPAANTLC